MQKRLLFLLMLLVCNSYGMVDSDASTIIKNREGWFYANVIGNSMKQYYPAESTTVIVKPIDFSLLRLGQVIVYTNKFGEEVIHVITEKVTDGFLVKGANNKNNDSTVLTKDNFIGIVYVTFNDKSNSSRNLLACKEK
jgi:hypothetical protein